MSHCNSIHEFVWQYEHHRKWKCFSDAEMDMLNTAADAETMTADFSGFTVDLEKMVRKNARSRYEQRVRCLISNSGLHVWLWKDNDNWTSFDPVMTWCLEIGHEKKMKIIQFPDRYDYEVNLETFTQVEKKTLASCSVKREIIEVSDTAGIRRICINNESVFKQSCTTSPPSAKKIRIDSVLPSSDSTNLGIVLDSSSFNPMNIDDSPKVKNGQSKITLIDSECPEIDNYHIYCDGDIAFSATLNQTNLQNNNNKFYIIQLTEHNQKKLYAVWRRWGRVGQKGQRDYTKYGSSLSEAISSFEKKFYDKTRNHWPDMEDFVHVKGKYDFLHMDLQPEVKLLKTAVESCLVSKVQSLLDIICDQKRMEEIMKEMSYDCNRTPLGKLTMKQVQEGYIALNKIATALATGKDHSRLLNACNQFYTKIPHNFGMKTPPIIQTQNAVDEKLKMLEALANITVAMGVLNAKSDRDEHPLDKYYRSLKCALEPIIPTSFEYLELENFLKETHGPTHITYEMEIIDAFKCYKEQEQSVFINYENKLLLWHGSRITNWLGILKEGLRIAPPEAPCSGYMFGKGIYFADVSSKSANYCCATKRKNEGLLILCEVSVGNQFPLAEAEGNMPVGLPSNFNSVWGKGRINPSNFKTGILSSEAKVPSGPLIENDSHEGSLIYNEYIVYNVKQVQMKYLLRVKFNFK